MTSFTPPEIDAIHRVIRERRDMRHFLRDPLPEGMLEKLVLSAHFAPSVGYMQPWRFIRITDRELRLQLHKLVMDEKDRTAEVLPTRGDEFRKVKIEGMLECAELLAVVLMPGRENHIIGRRLLPEMDVASVGCAIQNMWLAARAEGIGVGWVSFFDPEVVGKTLFLPAGSRALGLICIGQVAAFYPRPMFEEAGWGSRLSLKEILFENRWPDHAGPTPTPY